jgi:hypothetical protein
VSNFLLAPADLEIVDGLPGVGGGEKVLEKVDQLAVGDLCDCFGVHGGRSMPHARIRIAGLEWSDWVELPSQAGTVVCQGNDANSTPFTFGLRVSKKVVVREADVGATCVEIFCSLWVDNRSGLGLVVGAPEHQVMRAGGVGAAAGGQQSAEAALGEIAAILSVADSSKLTSFDQDYNWHVLAGQLGGDVWEEVFE